MQITFDTRSLESYRQFLAVKKLPAYKMRGRVAIVPDEYAGRLGLKSNSYGASYQPESFLFDYQADITRMAVEKRKFAVFADCGLGKSLILLSYARHAQQELGNGKRVLIFTPPMVVRQLAAEAERFWGDQLKTEIVKASNLDEWMDSTGDAIGITNYEALKKTTKQGNLGAMILDESSILKSHYGNYAGICIELGRGLEWKLCLTGTPAPNDRIEFANHGVFLDRFPTINAFLATYFINRGQTQERWALKPHALRPFYRSLSDWCIFLTNPAVYGWKDNCGTIPPINVHIEHVPLTSDQRRWVNEHLGSLVATRAGGIQTRGAYGQVAKGSWKGKEFETLKPQAIKDMLSRWPDESTLIWCLYDHEQDHLHSVVGGESLSGKTPTSVRVGAVERFKVGESKVLISKPRILGFGLNLQIATRQIFSGLQDSYESYYQCVKRSNRIGSTRPLNVHIPVTELEEPMIETVLAKAHRVEHDAREQELLFKEMRDG
ncbi:MAG: DEAD/DEAH box helicase [Planctomycetales bacterium]|nr:DEAD/DEAH box helicase [Planctomycetales bacterium]